MMGDKKPLPQSWGVVQLGMWGHGRLCATHPWEVIFSVITLTVMMLSVSDGYKEEKVPTTSQEYQGVDVVLMTVVRCGALLYTYHQFRTLHRIGSKYILGIAGVFAVFSSFVFSCSVIKLLDSDVSDLKDALFFFLLLVDLSKASLLAQFALSSSSQHEVASNIALGMARLGPSLTLDTMVEALVIGAGTLSGVSRLEQMCGFACLSVVVNYLVLMTFYPACLSLVLELSNRCSSGQPPWQMASLARALVDQEKPNPVVQRVKVIMCAGLLLVHGIRRWSLPLAHHLTPLPHPSDNLSFNTSSDPHIIVRLLNAGLDEAVVMVLLVALILKYVLLEPHGHLEEHLIQDSLQHSQTPATGKSRQRSQSCTLTDASSHDLLLHQTGQYREKATQTVSACPTSSDSSARGKMEDHLQQDNQDPKEGKHVLRSLEECVAIMNSKAGAKSLHDEEVARLVATKQLPGYKLEGALADPLRAVKVRRSVVAPHTVNQDAIAGLPFNNYDYTKVTGVCCENVIGYCPVPVGVAGPLLVNGCKYMIPMATTEGCLVASTNRGCRALVGGVKSNVIRDGMTRAPSIRLPSASRATQVFRWLKDKSNFTLLKTSFDSTSRFARLQDLQVGIAGRLLYTRFVAKTGDAMGMNMVSKGTEAALGTLKEHFGDMEILSVSGNYCMDKKPSAINWIEGRGKSVVCESIIPGHVVHSILKTTAAALVDANTTKNLVGSSLAGSIGGNNAHAANIVAAMYIACGQDPAQVVGSSNCMTLMEVCGENGQDLHMTVTMPSLEVGTVGGGTSLRPQSACLAMLGVKGAHQECPGENAAQFAKIVAATVLAGELSLMAALAAGHLVKSHLIHNRAKAATAPPCATVTLPTVASPPTTAVLPTAGIPTTTVMPPTTASSPITATSTTTDTSSCTDTPSTTGTPSTISTLPVSSTQLVRGTPSSTSTTTSTLPATPSPPPTVPPTFISVVSATPIQSTTPCAASSSPVKTTSHDTTTPPDITTSYDKNAPSSIITPPDTSPFTITTTPIVTSSKSQDSQVGQAESSTSKTENGSRHHLPSTIPTPSPGTTPETTITPNISIISPLEPKQLQEKH